MKQKNHYLTIKNVIEHIVKHRLQAQPLEEIARSLKMSPGHLQKVFTEWVGITPKQFSRYLSLQYSKDMLRQDKNISQIRTTVKSGLSSGGRLYDLFIDIEAMTPGEYRDQAARLAIRYSTFQTRFGLCLVASTGRGVCNVLFSDTAEAALKDLRSRWPKAKILKLDGNDAFSASAHRQIKEYFSGISPRSKIKFHLHGTNFQVKVWEALLSIPEGRLSTYGGIAELLGDKDLSRAVGAAIGDNPIGYIIPCHRVLKSTGEISGYRWGIARKQAMLLYEAMLS